MDNAVKYGNRGSVIEIELAELTGYAQVSVRNEGIGIEREEYHKVFQRFYRGKKTAEENGDLRLPEKCWKENGDI